MVNLSKALTGLAVLVSVGCVPGAEQREEQIEQEILSQAAFAPPTEVHQDYGMGWDKEVALYNINQILKDPKVCNSTFEGQRHSGYADKMTVSCWDTLCYENDGDGKLKYRKLWQNPTGKCQFDHSVIDSFEWDNVVWIGRRKETEYKEKYESYNRSYFENCLEIVYNGWDILTQRRIPDVMFICTADHQQYEKLKQAFDIYLRERKK